MTAPPPGREPSTDRRPNADRGVSPIVGIVLILAITLLLVAVAGSGFTSFGERASDTAPKASLSVDVNTASDTVTLEHDGGDSLSTDTTRVVITIDGSESEWSETGSGDVLTAGDTATFDFSGDPDQGPSSGPWSSYGDDDDETDNQIDSGDSVVVEIIDTDTQRIIYESRITA